MRGHLLIVADDFGYGKFRNLGIVECFKHQSVSAVSILANCKFTEHAVDLAKKFKIPTGLHFNLTEGYPLSNHHTIPSLITCNGKFLGKEAFWSSSTIVPQHVEIELDAQLSWFIDAFGKVPAHVDGHQHVHVHPHIATVFAKVLSKYGVQRTRLPIEYPLSVPGCNSKMCMKRIKFHSRIITFSKKCSSIFKLFNIKTTDGFIGLNLMGTSMTTEKLQIIIKNFFQSGFSTCELMCHPGYKCDKFTDGFIGEDFADQFSCSNDREHELKILTSKEMLQFYNDKSLNLIVEW